MIRRNPWRLKLFWNHRRRPRRLARMNRFCFIHINEVAWGTRLLYRPGGRRRHLVEEACAWYRVRDRMFQKLPSYRGDPHRTRLANRRRFLDGRARLL